MKNSLKIAICGATGLVGRTMLKCLDDYSVPIDKIVLYGSSKSAGSEIHFRGEANIVKELTIDNIDPDLDYALFSAGGGPSKIFAPEFAKRGVIAIDNSSAWRMNPECPLVVPEVNPDALKKHANIIANPNCSTIQMTLPLKALEDKFGLERVLVSTYQSVSGAGQKGVDKLNHEMNGVKDEALSKMPIFENTLFHSFNDDSGYTEEEVKMINETRKILSLPELRISATCVRLPIIGGHAESVNVRLKRDFDIAEIKETLAKFPNIIIMDDDKNEGYPTVKHSEGRDEVFVGRIRRDESAPNSLHLWVVSDNLRKGAAANAVQILVKMEEMK
jgi:aspartate-semialdehyde dehydrogenase